MKKLSAVIIVHNEEKNIKACLTNIKAVADEIIVLDSYSTDKTIERCKPYTNKIYQQEFKGFGQQKQDAVSKASHEWILQIDADERLSTELTEELQQWKSAEPSEYSGYLLPFHFYFMNKRLRFGGCSPEHHVRLFKKEKASYLGKKIHEGIQIDGPIGKLRYPVIHYSYDSFSEYLEKCNEYTTLIAQEKYARNKRFHVWHVLRLPGEFILRYIIKLGFLDGVPGLIYALISSYYAFMKHLKLLDVNGRA